MKILLATLSFLSFIGLVPNDLRQQKADQDTVRLLFDRLKHPDFDVQAQAADALVKLGPDVIPPLIEAMNTEDADIRYWVSHTLSKIGQPSVAPLIKELDSDIPRVRLLAVKTLGHISPVPKPVVHALIKSLKDSDLDVRTKAVEVVGWLKDEAAIPGRWLGLDNVAPLPGPESPDDIYEWRKVVPALCKRYDELKKRPGVPVFK